MNLRRTLMLSGGDVMPFFTRPICIVFAIAILYTFIGPYLSKKIKASFSNIVEHSAD